MGCLPREWGLGALFVSCVALSGEMVGADDMVGAVGPRDLGVRGRLRWRFCMRLLDEEGWNFGGDGVELRVLA